MMLAQRFQENKHSVLAVPVSNEETDPKTPLCFAHWLQNHGAADLVAADAGYEQTKQSYKWVCLAYDKTVLVV